MCLIEKGVNQAKDHRLPESVWPMNDCYTICNFNGNLMGETVEKTATRIFLSTMSDSTFLIPSDRGLIPRFFDDTPQVSVESRRGTLSVWSHLLHASLLQQNFPLERD